ncbi:MAG: UDP-N-acetylmuramoyl-tripeptide--D-alanyl-D-alanine ligase [Deltaproteobacteria bacterium]|jgi:UDP-N-acetylmuramoyl-tripeptide--D-alanyl-D-alanine ligase|nr:UDP-N-acetylmuramoyl-tripeptide--D-alanyl-D-alanine ligase [Deltaproteobacteria bacterium]
MMTLEEMNVCLGADIRTHLPGHMAGKAPVSFCHDSRAVEPGSLFVCLPGERVDGHDFAAQAAARGALAIIAERDPFAGAEPPLPVIRVENSRQALLELAEFWRGRTRARVVGVTGTAGKTSVKEVLAAALARHGKTAKNFLNMNSQIGLSISILNAPLDADYWVMEAGISEERDMDELGRVLRPDLAVIVNVGQCHLSGLGGKGVAYHKARLLAYLTKGGRALVNADYPELVSECRVYPAELKLFSSKRASADYFVSYKGPASAATGRYLIHASDGSGAAAGRSEDFEVIAPFRGSFGSENVAAVAGAAHLLGLSREDLAAGLAGADMPRQRFSCQFFHNLAVIDDSYNSNPLSAPLMVESAAEMAREKKLPLILVMGEMLELGDIACDMHRQLAKTMAEAGAAAVLWKGGQEKAVWDGLREGGFAGDFRVVQDESAFREGMGELFKKRGKSGVVLFKGSRGTRLDPFVEIFQKEFCPAQE